MMPMISVIIPAYNASCTILKTIESVQRQTLSNFELIIIDDGSTDKTLELVGTIKDCRLKVFSYENGGVSVARNRGLAHAKGSFIAFIDADDLWTPTKLASQFAALQEHPEAGVAYSWTRYISEDGKLAHTSEPIFHNGNVYAKLLMGNFLDSGSNPLIRRQAIDAVGEFDCTLTHGEDWDFYLRLAAQWSFVVVPEAQVLYRQFSESASSKIETMEKDSLRVIEKTFEAAPLEFQSLKKQSLANLYLFLAHLYLKRFSVTNGAKRASQKLTTAIRLHPQVLLNKRTQVLLTKLFLIQILSPGIAKYFLQRISESSGTRSSSLQC